MTLLTDVQSSQIQELRDRVSELEDQVALLLSLSQVDVIELRDIDREQAKSEIVDLFGKTEGPIYFSDIQAQLGIDYDLVVEVCKELIDEGEIILDGDTV